MKIGHGQQFSVAIGDPLSARESLAFWAVSVATTVVGDAECAAVLAPINMGAQGGGATHLDSIHNPPLAGQEAITLLGAKCSTVAAEDIRHL
jgi:hypothetical protein